MGRQKQLIVPLEDSVVESLQAGDQVQLSGVIYTARDMAHQRLCAQIAAGDRLPFDLKGAVIYFVGPTPARPGQVIGAAGPTTSSRMDAFSPILLAHGIKAMIGKGYRGEAVQAALVKHKAVHFATFGGAGALLARHITKVDVIAYDDLGPEAIRRLEVKDFPAVVAYDALGGSVYDR
jgi:fumarate hydratase subunit beta